MNNPSTLHSTANPSTLKNPTGNKKAVLKNFKLGERSKNILEKLLPLIKMCNEGAKQIRHKKSFSLVPIESRINSLKCSKTSKEKAGGKVKTKRSSVNLKKPADKSGKKPPTHKRIKSEHQKSKFTESERITNKKSLSLTGVLLKKGAYHTKKNSPNQKLTVELKEKMKEKRGSNIQKGSLQKVGKKHRRTASDSVKLVPKKPKDKAVGKAKSKDKHKVRAFSRSSGIPFEHSLKAQVTKGIKSKRSSSNKREKADLPSKAKGHKRSISTRIKINTYLNGESSKVIQVTQKANLNPSLSDSFDIDILNIAIRRANVAPMQKKKEVVLQKFPKDKALLKQCEEVKLTKENLLKLKYAKEVEELKNHIREHFKKHGEGPKTDMSFYRVGRQLGRGAFGKVSLAMHKLTGKVVAVKSVNKECLTDQQSQKKVAQECSILKLMRHPSIIRLYETFETARHILIVTELCSGGDLLTYVRTRRRLSESAARHIFHQLVQGLDYCHCKGVLHRDVKLENVLLNGRGNVKIGDFGVSKSVRGSEKIVEQCGTPAYIAPEILKGKGYEGFGADVWSAGVVLYAMLYGSVPFKATNMQELNRSIVKGKYSLKEGISEEAKNLLRRMIECNPRKRIKIEDIYCHKWMQGERDAEIFTTAETEAIFKEYDPEHKETDSLFTEQAIESTINDLMKNASDKSFILAPFNSDRSACNKIEDSVKELLVNRDVIKFAAKVRDIDRQYERNNNEDIDHGIYNKLISASSRSRDCSSENSDEVPCNSSASEEEFNELIRDDKFIVKNLPVKNGINESEKAISGIE